MYCAIHGEMSTPVHLWNRRLAGLAEGSAGYRRCKLLPVEGSLENVHEPVSAVNGSLRLHAYCVSDCSEQRMYAYAKMGRNGYSSTISVRPENLVTPSLAGRPYANFVGSDIYRVDEVLARTFNMLFVNAARASFTLVVISASTPAFIALIIPLAFV